MVWLNKVGIAEDGTDLLEGLDTSQRIAMDELMNKHVEAVNALYAGLKNRKVDTSELKVLLINIGLIFGAMADVSPNVYATEAYKLAIDIETQIGADLYVHGLSDLIT